MQNYPNFLFKISRWYMAQGESNAPEHWQGFEETALLLLTRLEVTDITSMYVGSNPWQISFYNDIIMLDPTGPTRRCHFHLEPDLVTAFVRVVPNSLSYSASTTSGLRGS